MSFDQPKSQPESDQSNVIINFQLLKYMFSKLACPQCHSEVQIVDNLQERRGLGHKVSLSCKNVECEFSQSSYTENPCKTSTKKQEGNHIKLMYATSLVFEKLARGIKGSKMLYGV